ncbi:MAG TPA: methyltransferase domain-containing protein [Bryobacteraceae bacterium]
MSAPAAFDRLAAHYDELWTDTPVGRAQRNAVWRAVDRLFRAGDRILDIGCGTGEDAAHFASRGVFVHAIDTSAAMVEQARRRGGFSVEVGRAEELARMEGVYDGALSNFGALNCVADLGVVARGLAQVVRPGGFVALCIMGRFCAGETLRYGLRLQFRKAVRRWGGRAESSLGTVWYPTVAQVEAVFTPDFALRRWIGIGGFRACADHRLLIFVRK